MQCKSRLARTWVLALLLSGIAIAAVAATHRLDEIRNTSVATMHIPDLTTLRRPIVKFVVRCDNSDTRGLPMFLAANGHSITRASTQMKETKEIQEFYARAIAMNSADSRTSATVDKIRFLAADIAAAEGKFKISGTMAGNHRALPPETGNYTAIVKKSAGHWRIVSIRELLSLDRC